MEIVLSSRLGRDQVRWHPKGSARRLHAASRFRHLRSVSGQSERDVGLDHDSTASRSPNRRAFRKPNHGAEVVRALRRLRVATPGVILVDHDKTTATPGVRLVDRDKTTRTPSARRFVDRTTPATPDVLGVLRHNPPATSGVKRVMRCNTRSTPGVNRVMSWNPPTSPGVRRRFSSRGAALPPEVPCIS